MGAVYDQYDDTDVIGGLTYDQEPPVIETTGSTVQLDPRLDQAITDSRNGTDQNYNGLLGYQPMDGYINLADSGSTDRVDYSEPEQPSMISGWIDNMKSLFGSTTDPNGRQQQSLAASIVLGAAGSVLKSISENKAIKAASDLENQKSSNKIKEKAEEENRIRTAASAMPVMAPRGTRTVARPSGILSQAR